MNNILNNDYIVAIMALFITLYALDLAKMRLPSYIKNLFNNTIFRIVFLSLLLVFRFDKAPHAALTVALLFVLTLDYLSYSDVSENFLYLESYINQKL